MTLWNCCRWNRSHRGSESSKHSTG